MIKILISILLPFLIFAEPIDVRLKEHIPYNETGPNEVGLISIGGKSTTISESTYIYVKKAAEFYKNLKPKFIILELNTPGGEVYSAEKISDVLKELDTQLGIPVVCVIDNWAISAGALLAYSCRFITVVKDGAMGAAEPITVGESGKMETASEKVNSALRADFANRAAFFDRNPYIAEAMVDKDIILVKRDGQVIKLDYEDQVRKTGLDPDQIISPKGKLLTLKANELVELGVADILLNPARTDKNLLFSYPFFKNIPNLVISPYTMDWKTQFLVLLANPVVSSLLFLGLMLSFYVELNTPGFGIAGSFAVIFLGLIIISSNALEVVNILEIVFVFLGIAFIVIDLVAIPTFGFLGVVGIFFFLGGLFGLMLPGIGSIQFEFDTQTFNAAGIHFFKRLGWLSGTFILGLILMLLLGKYVMPQFAGFRKFILQGGEQEGYISGPSVGSLPPIGSKGIVYATLRPTGKILIKDQIFEAISDGEYIEQGKPIVVIKIEGSDIVVAGENE